MMGRCRTLTESAIRTLKQFNILHYLASALFSFSRPVNMSLGASYYSQALVHAKLRFAHGTRVLCVSQPVHTKWDETAT